MLYYLTLLQNFLQQPLKKDKGATAVEYGLLVVLIAAVIIGVVTTIGTDVLAGFNKVDAGLP